MATYNQVSYGSQGSEVKKLQELLNQNGAKLTVDGIFGNQTKQAVMDYQKANKLAVDGIVGNNTWGTLTAAKPSATTTPTQTTAQATTPTTANTKPWSYDDFKVSDSTAKAEKNRQDITSQKPGEFTYGAYEKSDVVKQAEALLQQQLANKPGAYQSAWQTQLDETLNKILNREKFTYDLNGDALYQQYKDQYMLQGQQAMMDTMGQAQAMTGGYGNSYAQTAGQQTYQGYLQQLNDRVPELYQLALDQYNREGEDLYNQYGIYADRENLDYSRYRDTVSDYNTELERLTEDARYQGETDYSKFMDAYEMAYGQHRDSVSDWQSAMERADNDYWSQYDRDYTQYFNDRNLAYQQERDQVADKQWQDEFDEAKRQYDQAYAAKNSGGSGGSTGGSTSSGGDYSGTTYDDSGLDQSQIKEMQAWYGTTADGVWGNQSTQAADGRSVTEAWEYYQANKDDGTTQEITTYKQLRAALDELVTRQDSNGNKVTKSEISAAIRDAVRYGVITQNQAQNLLNIYTPKGNTY